MGEEAGRLEADRELLGRIRSDDPTAFEQFVGRYGDRIYGFGLRVCGEREDARDVVQETLMKAFSALRELKEPKALRSWLYRVVSNACLMKRRKGKFEPRRELSLDELKPRGPEAAQLQIPDVGSLPDDEAERREIQRAVRKAILELPVHYRLVLVMRDIEQLSTRETAEALQVPLPTVKMRLHRGRLLLRNRLADRFGKPPAAEAP